MKITDCVLHCPDKNFHVIVELQTDNGLSGWGAAFSQQGQVAGAFEWLRRFVIGENPLEVEKLTETLHSTTYWLGRGGAMTHAISAVNIALWDLAGKALEQPVSILLGGRHKSAVMAYASMLFLPVEDLPQRIENAKGLGFRAIKLGWEPFGHQSLQEDTKLIQLARASAGEEIVLLVDAGGSYPFWKLRFKDALERAKMLADYGVYWFEEPLSPDDIEGYVRLRESSPVKIAHGEVLTRRQSFVPYFDRGAMDIVQPDVAKVGGLSEMRRIAWMAEQRGIDIVPHGFNTAIGVASDIHLCATLSSRSFVEFSLENTLIDSIVHPPFRLNADGCLPVSNRPGLGIDIDTERLKFLQDSGFACPSWTWDDRREFAPSRDES
jgi:D-galactarolactone cycloisomerase